MMTMIILASRTKSEMTEMATLKFVSLKANSLQAHKLQRRHLGHLALRPAGQDDHGHHEGVLSHLRPIHQHQPNGPLRRERLWSDGSGLRRRAVSEPDCLVYPVQLRYCG